MENSGLSSGEHEGQLERLLTENAALKQELEDVRVDYRALQDEVAYFHFVCRPALDLWLDRHQRALEWPRLDDVMQWMIASVADERRDAAQEESKGDRLCREERES